MKILTFIFFGLLSFGLCAQTPLRPLNELITKVNVAQKSGAMPNISDVAYIGLRCGSLLNAVSARLEINGNGTSDLQSAKILQDRANDFNFVSIALYRSQSISTDEITKQGKSLTQSYLKQIAQNNTIATPLISADLESCKIEYQGFSDMAKKYQK